MILKKKVLPFFAKELSFTVKYQDLKNGSNLEELIQRSYGPKGLGILLVDQIPGYANIRKQTLPLFARLANLPKQTLQKYDHPEIMHRMGWSIGKEKINDKYDVSKGCFFINCKRDKPIPIPKSEQHHYSDLQKKLLLAENVWVDQMPELELNVKKMTKKMLEVGQLLARHIDLYAHKNVKNYKKNLIYESLKRSDNHIGRMLHYFPYPKTEESFKNLLCGWHNDYGIMTALTSAMYIDSLGKQYKLKDQGDGFTAKNRFAESVRINIPQNMLAFQIGQTTQVWTGGKLEATPHSVVPIQQIADKGISRNTMALFLDPRNLDIVSPPEGISQSEVTDKQAYNVPRLKDRWKNGMFYKDLYTANVKYYA